MACDLRTELAARATTDATARIVSAPHKRPRIELLEQDGEDGEDGDEADDGLDDGLDEGNSESGGCGLDISFLRRLIRRGAGHRCSNSITEGHRSPAARQVPTGECITPEREFGNY